MNALNKPTIFLQLPIVVWAATFSYCTYLYLAVKDLPSAHCANELMGYGHVIATFGNIVTFTLTLVLSTVYPERKQAFINRLFLLLSNLVTAAIYSTLVQHYNPNL